MNNIIPFEYKAKEIRVIQDEQGEPWWVAKDVCDVLGLSDPSMALRNLDNDEKGTNKVCTLKGPQEMLIINESGLYNLIIRSNKPEANKFRRWITHDVIPSIRKTGSYKIHPDINNLTRPTKVTFAFLAREYNGALRLARNFGLEGNQATKRQ